MQNAKYSCSRVPLIVSDFSIYDKHIVQVVAFHMLATNEEISKIEKTYV